MSVTIENEVVSNRDIVNNFTEAYKQIANDSIDILTIEFRKYGLNQDQISKTIVATLTNAQQVALQLAEISKRISLEEDTVKAKIAADQAELMARLYKEHGYESSIVDGEVVLGLNHGNGTVDKQHLLLDTEEQAKQYEVDSLLPEQLAKLQEEIDLLQTQDLIKINENRILTNKT